jgi:hypothetical protein
MESFLALLFLSLSFFVAMETHTMLRVICGRLVVSNVRKPEFGNNKEPKCTIK